VPWFGELADRGQPDHRGAPRQEPADSPARWPAARPDLPRGDHPHGTADRGWGRLLDHLAAAGPSSIEDLRTELGLQRQELEGAAGTRSGAADRVHDRWRVTPARDIATPASWPAGIRPTRVAVGTGEDPVAALGDLIARPCARPSLAPETELRRWFSWPWYWADFACRRPYRPGAGCAG